MRLSAIPPILAIIHVSLYVEHTDEAFNKGKQFLVSMLYEIEHTNDYIELQMDVKILCED